MCNTHTATSRRQKPRFPLPIAQPTDRTSLKGAMAAHSVYVSRTSQLLALQPARQCRPQRAAHRTGIIAGAGISHFQELWTWLRSWGTGEAFSYGPEALVPRHCQAPFPASVSLLSNPEQGEQHCNGPCPPQPMVEGTIS